MIKQQNEQNDKHTQRILAYLTHGRAALLRDGADIVLQTSGHKPLRISAARLRDMALRGLVVCSGQSVELTGTGKAARGMGQARPEAQGHIEQVIIETASGPQRVARNSAESPLALLYRRKGRDGRSLLSAREFDAGERLRGTTRGR